MQFGSFGTFLLIMLVVVVGFGFLTGEYLDLRVDNRELMTQVAALQGERERLIRTNNDMANQLQHAQADITRLQQEKELQRSEFQRLIEQHAAVCPSPATIREGTPGGNPSVMPTPQTDVKAGLQRWLGQQTNQRGLIGLSLASLLLIGVVLLSTHPKNQRPLAKRAAPVAQPRRKPTHPTRRAQ